MRSWRLLAGCAGSVLTLWPEGGGLMFPPFPADPSGAQHQGSSTEGMTTFQKIKSVIPGTAEHQETHSQTGSQYGTDDARYSQGTHTQGQSAGEHLGSSPSGTAAHNRRTPMYGGGSYETGTGKHSLEGRILRGGACSL